MACKMYGGGGTFATGPKAGSGDASIGKGSMGPGTFKTGPSAVAGNIGKKTKGTMTSGTKGDAKGEDSGGMA